MRGSLRAEYSFVESGRIDKAGLVKDCSLLADELGYSIFSQSHSLKDVFGLDVKHGNFGFKTLSATRQGAADSVGQLLISRASNTFIRSSTRWLLYTAGILAGSPCNHSILTLVRICNIIRNYMVVSGVGLSNFVQSSRFSLRHSRSEHQRLSTVDGLEADIDSHTYREFRITPNAVIGNDRGAIDVTEFSKGLKQLYIRSVAENAHFVIHFTRGGQRSNRLQESIRNSLKAQVDLLQDFSHSITFSEHDLKINPVLSAKASVEVDIRKAIRGYDIAGNENELPVEIFSPALRVLRESKYPTRGLKFNRLHKPFLTVHAGEDYSHILSGMRAIDETVLFCAFQSGDRIGHGLALGVIPSEWAHKQNTAYVTVGDHLDNLVWCYQKALLVVQSVPQMVGTLQLLRDKIHFWSEYLYGESHPPKRLHDAWRLRRNCPLKTLSLFNIDGKNRKVEKHDAVFKGWIVDFHDEFDTRLKAPHVELWKKYLYANNDREFFSRREQIVSVDCSGHKRTETFGFRDGRCFDSTSSSELDLYEAIQDWCIEHYSDKEISFEACPTSNIYIGRFERYHEHPIYRWCPPDPSWISKGGKFNRFGLRKGELNACINTDDAALMPTTIQNEYRLLQCVAIEYYDISSTKAADWIDRLRIKGVQIFENNHLDWAN
ncbi:hypothetical protein [Vibrio scophthalmi]|uniref:Adenosine deaminase n=1 Tax=Vibrio scophthalmi TaxID=45658 RepID=A0A1C7FFL3_9VIBR|nr:hypothetical protein [Vibrio scophthalmi]ANU38203.1 hypothetical protein VSVS05_03165 [Vibrio scophthalmi]